MIRRATYEDIPRISEIRNSVRENRPPDPPKVTFDDVKWFIDNPGIFLWEEGGTIAGFSAADPRDGGVWALFMDRAFEGRGIGRTFFERACSVLTKAGFERMWLTTERGSRAERFYRSAGWTVVSHENGELLMEKVAPPKPL